METWFSNVKYSVFCHLKTDSHNTFYKEHMKEKAIIHDKKEKIFKTMRHLAYFTVKSNLPLEQFETFLATSHSCGLELGNINHSRLFVTKFLSLVDTQLISKTVSWFKDQENVTITLDIGTENG